MEPASRALDPDTRPIRPLAFPNGVLKKHHLPRPLPLPPPLTPPQAADLLYRECLKNHAASRGGHALDGCGEFMPSPAADPTDPASLTCAACGCHRNFHRRLPDPRRSGGHADDHEAEDEMDGSDDDEDEYDEDHRRKRQQSSGSPPPPPPYSSAPHMLLALSAGLSGGGAIPSAAVVPSAAPLPRKRFRTKFSPEQKEKMQELSERLGWRMQKRDEGLVEELCHKIGVGKGVFKVWMHNNKHHFVSGSSRRGGEIGSSEVTADGAVPDVSAACGGGIEGTGSFHPVNGSC